MILYTVRCTSGSGMVLNQATGKVSNATCGTWDDNCRGGAHVWRRPEKAGNPRERRRGAAEAEESRHWRSDGWHVGEGIGSGQFQD